MRRAKKRKGIEAQRAKPSTPSQDIDGDKEENEKQKKNKERKKHGMELMSSLPVFWRLEEIGGGWPSC